MDSVSAAGGAASAADAGAPLTVAVARKALDLLKATGQAEVRLIEAAGEVAPPPPGRLDVYA